MTPQEIRRLRDRLELGRSDFWRLLGMDPASGYVWRMEQSERPIPESVALLAEAIEAVPGIRAFLATKAGIPL